MIGGSADLAGSVGTTLKEESEYSAKSAGRNVHWGVREHAMAAAVNGLALHGGIVKPYGATFLIFSDYMRPSIRLSALMNIPSVWVFSHDSLGVGEDGPTHQPVEQLASLRAIPNLTVIRPADANETLAAWEVITELKGPACIVLSRQGLPVFVRQDGIPVEQVSRGAYVLTEGDGAVAEIVATGSEVALAVEAQGILAAEGTAVRVISMPSWELFELQDSDYKQSVLTPGLPKLSVEAGVSQGWDRYVDRSIAVDRFGASAPGGEVFTQYGFTVEAVVSAVNDLLS